MTIGTNPLNPIALTQQYMYTKVIKVILLFFLNKKDSYLAEDFHLKSQGDAVLSQDSTYQGDQGYMNSLPDYSQPNYASQY